MPLPKPHGEAKPEPFPTPVGPPIPGVPAPAPVQPSAEVIDDVELVEEPSGSSSVWSWLGWGLFAAASIAIAAVVLGLLVPSRDEARSLRAELDGVAGELEGVRGELAGIRDELSQSQTARDSAEDKSDEMAGQVAALEQQRDQLAQTIASKEAELETAQKKLEESLGEEIKAGDVSVKKRGDELVVGVASRVLFERGDAQLNDRGKKVLRRVGETIIANAERAFQVAGHTDDDPVTGQLVAEYPTNWELSTARATNVVRFLQEDCKVPGRQLVAAGFAEHRPTASNKNERGKRKNRRIEITMLARPLPKGK